MPKDFYDKLTVISDAASKNKALVLMILAMLGSGATNTFQYLQSKESIFMNTVMKETITMLANNYVKPKECKK